MGKKKNKLDANDLGALFGGKSRKKPRKVPGPKKKNPPKEEKNSQPTKKKTSSELPPEQNTLPQTPSQSPASATEKETSSSPTSATKKKTSPSSSDAFEAPKIPATQPETEAQQPQPNTQGRNGIETLKSLLLGQDPQSNSEFPLQTTSSEAFQSALKKLQEVIDHTEGITEDYPVINKLTPPPPSTPPNTQLASNQNAIKNIPIPPPSDETFIPLHESLAETETVEAFQKIQEELTHSPTQNQTTFQREQPQEIPVALDTSDDNMTKIDLPSLNHDALAHNFDNPEHRIFKETNQIHDTPPVPTMKKNETLSDLDAPFPTTTVNPIPHSDEYQTLNTDHSPQLPHHNTNYETNDSTLPTNEHATYQPTSPYDEQKAEEIIQSLLSSLSNDENMNENNTFKNSQSPTNQHQTFQEAPPTEVPPTLPTQQTSQSSPSQNIQTYPTEAPQTIYTTTFNEHSTPNAPNQLIKLTRQQKRSLLSRSRQFGLLAPSALLNLMESVSIIWRQVTEERMTSKDLFIFGALLAIEERILELKAFNVAPAQLQPLEEQLERLKAALLD